MKNKDFKNLLQGVKEAKEHMSKTKKLKILKDLHKNGFITYTDLKLHEANIAKIRPLGDITLDMEKYFEEMVLDHDLQIGEIMNLVYGYLMIHHPDAQEKYLDGTTPVFYYGEKK